MYNFEEIEYIIPFIRQIPAGKTTFAQYNMETPAFVTHSSNPKRDFVKGMRAGLPVLIGYFPIAITFGVLSTESISFHVSLSLSFFVYAGASQFMALRLLGAGAPPLEIVFAVFMMNLRHFLMCSSVARRLNGIRASAVPLVSFWVTDETFAVFMSGGKEASVPFLVGLEVVAYASWVIGTAAGFIGGSFLPSVLQESMGVALYALFIALLVPSVKREYQAGVVAAISAGVNTLLGRAAGFQPGWSIIAAILSASFLGALLLPAPKTQGGGEQPREGNAE
jgi:4-azaleucine resistance transporter AzlC